MNLTNIANIHWDSMVALATFIGVLWRLGVKIVVRIEKLADQLKPNGGSSLRDAIDRVEKGIALGEKRARILFDQASGGRGWFETGPVGDCTFVSAQWCLAHGVQRSEAMGQGWLNGIAEASRESFVLAVKFAIADGRSFETAYMTAAGGQCRVHAERVLGPSGSFLGFIGYVEVFEGLSLVVGGAK